VKNFTKSEKKILVFVNTGHFLVHTLILVFPSIVTPLSREFSLPFNSIIKLSFPMYLFYGIGALPAGLISDHLKPKITLIIYFFGIGLFCILTSLTKTPLQLQLSLMFLGIFLSIYHPAGLGLISMAIRKRGSALGLNGIFGSAGIAMAPFTAGLINYLWGWRNVYLILSIVPIIFGIILFFTGFEVTSGEQSDAGTNHTDSKFRLLPFFILCISMALAGFVYRGQTIILPTYFEKKVSFLYDMIKGLNNIKLEGTRTLAATVLTSLVYLISIFGQIMGGKIADRYDLRYSYFFFFLFSLPFLIFMYFFDEIILFVSSIMFIFFSVGMQPVENSLIARFTPSKWRNTSYGIKFILTFGVSSTVIYPIAFFQSHFTMNAVFLLFSLIITLLLINNYLLIFLTKGSKVINQYEKD